MGKLCVICQDTSRHVAPLPLPPTHPHPPPHSTSPQGELQRTGWSDVHPQPIAGLSPCLPSGVEPKVWDVEGGTSFALPTDPPCGGSTAFVSVSHSHHKTSRLCVETKRCWTLAEDSVSEWEERKKNRAGGGAPCEPRKTVFFFPLLWQTIPVTIRPDSGCWATSGRRSTRRALQLCLSCTCFFMLCMHHPSLCLALLRCLFFFKTNLKSVSNRLVRSLCSTPRVVVT